MFNFPGYESEWKTENPVPAEITAPDGKLIRLKVVGEDIEIETSDLLIVLQNGLPGYTSRYRIVYRATEQERQVVDTRIGTRSQVSIGIVAYCLMTGETMEYHWVSPILDFAKKHRVMIVA